MIVVFVGPSGSGKSTVITAIRNRHPTVKPIESFTTRPKRETDVPGEQVFVTNKEFYDISARGEFLWVLTPYGMPYRYGARMATLLRCLQDTSCMYASVLSGPAAEKLWVFAQEKGLKEQVRFIFFEIEDINELQRRMDLDPTRTHVKERLMAVPQEHVDAHASGVPFHFVNASQPIEVVIRDVERIMPL